MYGMERFPMLAYLVMDPLGPHPLIRSFDRHLPVQGFPQPARVGRLILGYLHEHLDALPVDAPVQQPLIANRVTHSKAVSCIPSMSRRDSPGSTDDAGSEVTMSVTVRSSLVRHRRIASVTTTRVKPRVRGWEGRAGNR